MAESDRETQGGPVVEGMETHDNPAVEGTPHARLRRSSDEPGDGPERRPQEFPPARGLPAVHGATVMGHLTIRELEMTPKMDEIRRLEELPVGGTTNIQPEVIGAIAGVAAQAVEGVASLGTTSLRRTLSERLGGAERRSRGVEVEVGIREAILDINLRVVYGHSIPAVVVAVRRGVAERLLTLAGLVAKEINVRVVGLEFPARMPGRVD